MRTTGGASRTSHSYPADSTNISIAIIRIDYRDQVPQSLGRVVYMRVQGILIEVDFRDDMYEGLRR